MERNNKNLKIVIDDNGDAQFIPLKGKKIKSKNGKEYYRYNPENNYYNNLSKEKKLEFFKKAQKRLNENEFNYIKNRFSTIVNRSKNNNNNKIYKCFFSFEEFLTLWESHKIKYGGPICAISGKKMTMIALNDKNKKYQRNWLNVSVDRIDSNKPYTLQNIVFVTWEVNRSKNDISIDHMKKFISIYEDRFIKLKSLN
jgi:hypothetical protein